MDLQSAFQLGQWIVIAVTAILLIVAASLAIKKKNNIAFAAALFGNLVTYYFLKSPLICMIVSIAVIIWVSASKSKEPREQNSKPNSDTIKQSLKTSNAREYHKTSENKKMVKPGQIIGLILGILIMGFPIIGFMIGEASLSDSKGKMMGYGFIIFGAFMIIVNIIGMVKGTDNLLASDKSDSPKAAVEEPEESSRKIRCRFCKKLYNSEYNGCPHCKKK